MSGSGNLNATPNTCATTVCWTGVCFGRVGCPVCWCREPHERVPQGTHVEPRGRGPQGLSPTDLIPYTLYLYLVPCPGLIGHPMGSFETLYRSNWSSRWDLHDEMGPSIQIQCQMVDNDETMKMHCQQCQKIKKTHLLVRLIQGSGGHLGGSRADPGAENYEKMGFQKLTRIQGNRTISWGSKILCQQPTMNKTHSKQQNLKLGFLGEIIF